MNNVKEQLVNIRNNRRINIKTCINDKNHTSILLIHGSMASLEQYNYQFDYIIQNRPDINIIAYDTYGCGKSDKNLDDFEAYNTKELELDMLAVFDKFKRKKNIVVGHSYGTSMCLRLSYLRQDEVDGA